MAKPRIIIADTDSSYIIPLQLRFVEEFFDKIDLEIITEKEFFESTFAAPQRVNLLIVSEDLYDASLKKHNIGKVFVMMEQYEEDQTDDLNINRIFKYTSIKEIFNEIIGKSSELQASGKTKTECQIVLVDSACGGTGKTTIALGISLCLTKNYKRVLYINASRLQTFQRILNNQTPISEGNIYAKLTDPAGNIYDDIKHVIRKEQFSYLPPFKAALISLGLSYSIYERIVVSAKKSNDYDYIVVDVDSAFDDDKASLLNIADKVIIVTDQTEAAVFATNILIANINGANSEKYFFICNNFENEKDNALISPILSLKFTIDDYVEHMEHFDNLRCEEYAKKGGIQRAAFLVM